MRALSVFCASVNNPWATKKSKKTCKKVCKFKFLPYICSPVQRESSLKRNFFAEIAQLVEHDLAKVGVASSSLVFRSKTKQQSLWLLFLFCGRLERSDPSPLRGPPRSGEGVTFYEFIWRRTAIGSYCDRFHRVGAQWKGTGLDWGCLRNGWFLEASR